MKVILHFIRQIKSHLIFASIIKISAYIPRYHNNSYFIICLYDIWYTTLYVYIYLSPMPPQVICRLRGPPSWAWLECNCLLILGRKWGVVMLPRSCVNGDRLGCSASRGLKSKFYQFTQTMVTAGIFPFKENCSHYSNLPTQAPIFKRFRFQNLARILVSQSERFRGVFQSLQ